MFFKAELTLALCLVWGLSCGMTPSDLYLLLLCMALGLEIKGKGAGNARVVVHLPGYAQCPAPWTVLLREEEEMFPWAAALQRYHLALEGPKRRVQTHGSSLFTSLRGTGACT